MIVKNEAHILERCLESVLPYIDAWAICDTGSTDGTQELVRKLLAGVPGTLAQDSWVDFGTNRTHGLELARKYACDYTLVIDADEVLVVEDPKALAGLDKDAYRVEMHHSDGMAWPRVNLLRTALPWRYRGIIHEHAECEPPVQEWQLSGVYMWTDGHGARGQDPDKALKDLAVMRRSVELEPENSRYWFYLAQGYEVAKLVGEAKATYEHRITLGGNPDEVWYSRFRLAQLLAYQGEWERAVPAYLEAYASDPGRIEPLFYLAQGYINRGQDYVAMVFLEAVALGIKPVGAMFVDEPVYDYLRWLQYAITAQNTGDTEAARDVAARLLASGKAPTQYHEVLTRLLSPTVTLEAPEAAMA